MSCSDYNASRNSIEQSHDLEIEYVIKYKPQLKSEKIEKVADGVAAVQKSIDWDDMDLRIANRRLRLPNNPKIIVKDFKTKELLGYAILVPQEGAENSWYISQIAVMKGLQGRGIGKAVMQKIFDEARKRGVNKVTLDTDGADEKLLKFYQSFHSESTGVHAQHVEAGKNRFGQPTKIFIYELLPPIK